MLSVHSRLVISAREVVRYAVLVEMQGKVKVVADAVWLKLTGVFANDVLHVQVRVLVNMFNCGKCPWQLPCQHTLLGCDVFDVAACWR